MCLCTWYSWEREAYLPCGKCEACRARRASDWCFRLMQEERVSSSAYFITLTYDEKYVPVTASGQLSLKKRDLNLFFKKLRRAHGSGDKSIKYYAVGEYGGIFGRPHYHIILFNARVELIQDAWSEECFNWCDSYSGDRCFDYKSLPIFRKNDDFCGAPVYRLNRNHWIEHRGHVDYGRHGEFGAACVAYALKYMTKPSLVGVNEADDRQRTFAHMSKGLGISYLEDSNFVEWHVRDLENRKYVNVEGGVKAHMPRYYSDKLYLPDELDQVNESFERRLYDQLLRDYDISIDVDMVQAVNASWRRVYDSFVI